MANLFAQAISSDDADHAAKIIGIENDDVVDYCFRRNGRLIANTAPATSATG